MVALRSPTELRERAGLDDVDSLLKQGVTLEYAPPQNHYDPQIIS